MDQFSFKTERITVLPTPIKNTLAFADLEVNGGLVIRGLRVCKGGETGVFVSFPQEVGKDKKWHDQVYFKDKTRTHSAVVSETVLKSYEEAKNLKKE